MELPVAVAVPVEAMLLAVKAVSGEAAHLVDIQQAAANPAWFELFGPVMLDISRQLEQLTSKEI